METLGGVGERQSGVPQVEHHFVVPGLRFQGSPCAQVVYTLLGHPDSDIPQIAKGTLR